MSTYFLDLSNQLWSLQASSSLDALIGDEKWAPLALLGLSYGMDYLSKLNLGKSGQLPNTSLIGTLNNSVTQNISTSNLVTTPTTILSITPTPVQAASTASPASMQSTGTMPATSVTSSAVAPSTHSISLNIGTDIILADAMKSVNSHKLGETQIDLGKSKGALGNIKGQAAGAVGGMAASMAVNALGNKVLGDSKGALLATGVASLAAGQIGGLVASNIANGASALSGVSSLGSVASLGQAGLGLANVALDVLDPVVKSDAENIANMVGAAAMMIPGAGWIVGSAMLTANAIGHAAGQKTLDYHVNTDLIKDSGSSYLGTAGKLYEAQGLAGAKYSAYNSSGRHKADDKITAAKLMEHDLGLTVNYNKLRKELAEGTSAINGTRAALDSMGGYDQRNGLMIGRNGIKLNINRARSIINKLLKEGPIITPDKDYNIFLNSLPDNLRLPDESEYRMYRYWELNGKPKDFKELISKGLATFNKNHNLWHTQSIAYNKDADEFEFMKPSTHKTVWMEELAYNSKYPLLKKGLDKKYDDGLPEHYDIIEMTGDDKTNMDKFREEWELDKSDSVWKYKRKPKKNLTSITLTESIEEFKNGGLFISSILLIEPDITSFIQLTEPIEEFKNGGLFNVIPEGALHAHKHNMDNDDNITKKGIPVIDNNGQQQAEIEKEEIILRLEVTESLENLEKKFYNENSSLKDKDEAALEAGKLLVKEILHNTIDNTNNLL